MATSEYCSCPPRLPTPTASHVAIASGVNHRVTSPRWTSARSYAGQFPTRYFVLYLGCTLDFTSRSCPFGRHDGQGRDEHLLPRTNATDRRCRGGTDRTLRWSGRSRLESSRRCWSWPMTAQRGWPRPRPPGPYLRAAASDSRCDRLATMRRHAWPAASGRSRRRRGPRSGPPGWPTPVPRCRWSSATRAPAAGRRQPPRTQCARGAPPRIAGWRPAPPQSVPAITRRPGRRSRWRRAARWPTHAGFAPG